MIKGGKLMKILEFQYCYFIPKNDLELSNQDLYK